MKKTASTTLSKNTNAVRWVLGSLVGVTLYFQTNIADPFNSPKSWLLYLSAASLLGYLFSCRKIVYLNKNLRSTLYVLLFFIISMLISLVFTDVKYIAFFGDTQRRNGFLSYLSLAIIFFAAAVFVRTFNIKRLYLVTYATTIITIIYAFLQFNGKDFVDWVNPYNSIIGTVGNPNFAAAVMAIMGVVLFASFFINEFGIKYRFSLFVTTCLLLVMIYKSGARQGLITYIIGVGLFIVIYFIGRNRTLGLTALVLGALFSIFSILGMLQIGPLERILYKPSVSVRGYYWDAALDMFLDNPIFGVGIDRYGAYFKEYRQVGYSLNYGFDITSSNAHNTFLQFFATGGFFLGISYLCLNAFILYKALTGLKRLKGNSRLFLAGILTAWVAFHAQSLISIDNVGVSIWGWVLGGSIIGLSVSENTSFLEDQKIFLHRNNQIDLSRALVSGISAILVLPIVIFLYRADTNTFNAKIQVNLQNPQERELFKDLQLKVLSSKLNDPTYALSSAMDLIQAGFLDEGLSEVIKIHTNDPRNLDAINALALTYESQKNTEKAIFYREKMAELDPWNAVNYLQLGKNFKTQGNFNKAKDMLDKISSFASGDQIYKQAQIDLTR